MIELSAKRGHSRPPRGSALVIVASIVLVVAFSNITYAQTGKYQGELVFKSLPDGRYMQLVKPFAYLDSHGVSWPVPAGTKVDGASIPRALWTILGAPYTGKYRDASVIQVHVIPPTPRRFTGYGRCGPS